MDTLRSLINKGGGEEGGGGCLLIFGFFPPSPRLLNLTKNPRPPAYFDPLAPPFIRHLRVHAVTYENTIAKYVFFIFVRICVTFPGTFQNPKI